jgi:hypothetical protein
MVRSEQHPTKSKPFDALLRIEKMVRSAHRAAPYEE